MKDEPRAGNPLGRQVHDQVMLRQACVDAAGGEPLMFIDGHDTAIVGLVEVDGEPRVVYDIEAIVHELMRRDGMDSDGAVEFLEYNVMAACFSGGSPLFVHSLGWASD
ncbi:hypothetical protein SRABI118_02432 [Massilia sp. Bi118]|uniref:hypothetical protein n=1 Tax=Massilia sp. Bi118 TaxID=2822346 RepID=UPI001DB510A8|nr:hypothetical protein [Massilia sp. Bi118]CAH0229604.1 hypothetical protein SRABI118_02432 [Massilia sp. Bi118]